MNNTFCKIAMQKIGWSLLDGVTGIDLPNGGGTLLGGSTEMIRVPHAGGYLDVPKKLFDNLSKNELNKYLNGLMSKGKGFVSDLDHLVDSKKLPATRGEHNLSETVSKKTKELLSAADKKGSGLLATVSKGEVPAVLSRSGSSFLPAIAETAAKSGGKGGKILAGLAGLLGIGGAGAAGAYHALSEKSTLDALKELAHEHPWHAAGAGAAAAGAAGGSAVGIKKLLSKAKKAKAKPVEKKGLAKLKELLKAVKR